MAKLNTANARSSPYWHRYFTTELAERAGRIVEVHRIPSTGVMLHIDVYPQAANNAPVIVLIHGGGGYGGLFAGLALAFHDRGYTVVVPDQRGQGRSGGVPGDFTISEAVTNIVDVALWAREHFDGTLFLAGCSIGGGLVYYAAVTLATRQIPPAAILCLDIYDFGDPRTALEFSRFAGLARLPGVPAFLRGIVSSIAALAPHLQLPYQALAKFRRMIDDRDHGAYAIWRADPHTLRSASARYFASVMNTPAPIRFEDNKSLRVLVVNQRRDAMVRPAVTREAARRLNGPVEYTEIDWGHFSLNPEFSKTLAELGDKWFCGPRRQQGGAGGLISTAANK